MKLTVADLYNIPALKGLRLIAGEEGLKRQVDSCGILDYEYDKSVSEKYCNINFQKNQFVLSSFLYAKDNEFLIMDAVKKLVARGVSGLAIKNIFRIPLHDNLLRYADSMGFPIFLIEDPAVYFELFIIEVTDRIRKYSSIHYREAKAEQLMKLPPETDPNMRLSLCLEINPALCSDLAAVCFHSPFPFTSVEFLQLEDFLSGQFAACAENSMFYYKNGFFLILSSDMFDSADPVAVTEQYIQAVAEYGREKGADLHVGVSRIHHSLHGLGTALQESLYASAMHKVIAPEKKHLTYHGLGVYQLLLPAAELAVAHLQYRQYLQPLADYDIEHKTHLHSTVIQFVLCGGKIDRTAELLQQHKNTVRYRIEKVSKLCGFSILQPEHYEKISIAVKLHLCSKAMRRFDSCTKTQEAAIE